MPKPKRFIVKVQLSLTTTHHCQQALIYNKSRTVQIQLPVEPSLREAMTIDEDDGPEAKMFWWAWLDREQKLHLEEFAPWQEW